MVWQGMHRTLSRDDIEQWIDNEEGLYLWWKSSGMGKREFVRRNRAELERAINDYLEARKPSHQLSYEEGAFMDNPITSRVVWTGVLVGAAALLIGGVAYAAGKSKSGGGAGPGPGPSKQTETVIYRGVSITLARGPELWSASWSVNNAPGTASGPTRDQVLTSAQAAIDQLLQQPGPSHVQYAAHGAFKPGPYDDGTVALKVGQILDYMPYNNAQWNPPWSKDQQNPPLKVTPAQGVLQSNGLGQFTAVGAGTATVEGSFLDTWNSVTGTRFVKLTVNVSA